jgi:hypothetical protein
VRDVVRESPVDAFADPFGAPGIAIMSIAQTCDAHRQAMAII